MSAGVGERYRALVASKAIEADAAQLAIIDRLEILSETLRTHAPPSKGSALGWLFARKAQSMPPLKGLYVWGEVGRGKTMIMDLFYAALPVAAKRRVHFHAFMQDVHERVHEYRQKLRRGEVKGDDPMPPVAAQLAAEARVLCFDEFAVTDIADAMILARLFTQLYSLGVVVIATSNVHPDNLYRDGLNRALFVPFIGMLLQHMDVMRLDARTDFRMEKLGGAPVWHCPLTPQADVAMDAAWERMTGLTGGSSEDLLVKGRKLHVPRAAVGCARFGFEELIERPLGAADFLALARTYRTIFLDHIKIIDQDRRNDAKRFITLIDAMYDHGVKLVASAEVEPHLLYVADYGKEAFEIQRTVSRLIEMRSDAYLMQPHVMHSQSDEVTGIET
jgi:cell division protein ZapE